MGRIYKIKPATDEAIIYLANNLRKIDKEEADMIYPGHSLVDALKDSVSKAKFCGVLYDEDEPILITGVNPGMGGMGVGWMVATDKIKSIPRKFFMRESAKFVDMYHTWFPAIGNLISEKNHTSIKWLTKLGFIFGDSMDYNGHQCKRFYKHKLPETFDSFVSYDNHVNYDFGGYSVNNMDITQYIPNSENM